MEIVKFYQDVGLGNANNGNDQVWAKMKGAAGGDSPDPSWSRSGSASREMSRENSHEGGAPKFANPVSFSCLSREILMPQRTAPPPPPQHQKKPPLSSRQMLVSPTGGYSILRLIGAPGRRASPIRCGHRQAFADAGSCHGRLGASKP